MRRTSVVVALVSVVLAVLAFVASPAQIRVDPQFGAVGRATFRYAVDQGPRALTAGTAVNSTISIKGQNATFTFAGTVGQHVTFDVTASSWTVGTAASFATLSVVAPSGASAGALRIDSGTTGFLDVTPTATGTYRVTLDPSGEALGSTTFTYARDVPTVALVVPSRSP